MVINISARHFKAWPELTEIVTATANKFLKYADGITRTEIVLDDDNGKIVEFTVYIQDHVINAKDSSDLFDKSIHGASNKIISQLKKVREKQSNHRNAEHRPLVYETPKSSWAFFFCPVMSSLKNIQSIQKSNIPVDILLQSPVKLIQINPSINTNKPIIDKNIHRPQLALAGFVQLFTHNRVQVFGNTEMYYLKSLSSSESRKAFSTLCTFEIPCIILTNNHEFDEALMEEANKAHIPVFRTHYETTKAIYLLTEFLDDQFAEQATLHGSFVDVYGVGVLLIGRSGIGKSEIALDLVERGHRLVCRRHCDVHKKERINSDGYRYNTRKTFYGNSWLRYH
jgi:ribosomal subunit interface protein